MLTCLHSRRLEESSNWNSASTNNAKIMGRENVRTYLTGFVARLRPSSIPMYNLWTTTVHCVKEVSHANFSEQDIRVC